MVVFSLWDIVVMICIIIALVVLLFKIGQYLYIKWLFRGFTSYNPRFGNSHNCYDCLHYRLENVASAGDCCWYKCKKFNRIDQTSMNTNKHYENCKEFIYKENK